MEKSKRVFKFNMDSIYGPARDRIYSVATIGITQYALKYPSDKYNRKKIEKNWKQTHLGVKRL